ncbi:MAG: glycyl-radical enzyme activating protein [Acetivibrio ethanolgignens]
MKGYVFDFKRFSTHDGHGIRTTVFLKGCTINCVWCHNPEGISIRQRPLYFPNKCIHCNTCVHLAENEGVKEINGKIKLDISKNENWHYIIDSCPSAALTMDSREMTVQEVVEEACKDEPFFKYGGGVTLSGGEPLFQHAFAIEILKGLREKNIATTIETASHIPTKLYQEAMNYVDYVFADLKIIDSRQHKKYTGVTNELVKQNLEWLLTSDKAENVTIRTPLIPDMTATEENIAEIARFISGLYQEVKYEILNYNPLAQAKYDMVDKAFCFEKNRPSYSDNQMRAFGKIAADNGIKNLILEI